MSLLHVVEHLPAEVSDNIVLPDQKGIEDHLLAAAEEARKQLKNNIDIPDITTVVF